MVKIYTKTGDKGFTTLVGGTPVSKASDRVEAYGTVDELNSWVGYIVSSMAHKHRGRKEELQQIQHLLFDCGTDLSTPSESEGTFQTREEAVHWLEERIDFYVEKTKPIDRFILPGGSDIAAKLHIARTMTRRAERLIVVLSWEERINPVLIQFINRLSDYFFVLARFMNEWSDVEDVVYERTRELRGF